MIIDSWNIQTQAWFKFVCFERLQRFNTLAVIALSMIWHGFEARFFFAFAFMAIVVQAGRNVRFIFITIQQPSGLKRCFLVAVETQRSSNVSTKPIHENVL
jgi:hypothetical protein